MTQSNSWGLLLTAHRKRRGLNQDEMAKLTSKTQAMISHYESGNNLPPLSQATEFADILGLTGTDRSTFIEEAYLAHAPDVIRCLIQELRVRVRRLEKRTGVGSALNDIDA